MLRRIGSAATERGSAEQCSVHVEASGTGPRAHDHQICSSLSRVEADQAVLRCPSTILLCQTVMTM